MQTKYMIINRLLLLLFLTLNISFTPLEENDFHSYSYYYKKELLESSNLPILLNSLNIESSNEINNFIKELKKSEFYYLTMSSLEQYGNKRPIIQSIRLYAELRMLGYTKEELESALTEPDTWHDELSILEKGSIIPEYLDKHPDIKSRITEIKKCFPFIPAKRLSFYLHSLSQKKEILNYKFFELRLPYENMRQENYHLFLYSTSNCQLISLGGFYYGIAIIEDNGQRSIIIDHSAHKNPQIDPKTKKIVYPDRIERNLNDIHKSGFYNYEKHL